MATTPIAMSIPVRIRFFSFDLGVRLISILLVRRPSALTAFIYLAQPVRCRVRYSFPPRTFQPPCQRLRETTAAIAGYSNRRLLKVLLFCEVAEIQFSGLRAEETHTTFSVLGSLIPFS